MDLRLDRLAAVGAFLQRFDGLKIAEQTQQDDQKETAGEFVPDSPLANGFLGFGFGFDGICSCCFLVAGAGGLFIPYAPDILPSFFLIYANPASIVGRKGDGLQKKYFRIIFGNRSKHSADN